MYPKESASAPATLKRHCSLTSVMLALVMVCLAFPCAAVEQVPEDPPVTLAPVTAIGESFPWIRAPFPSFGHNFTIGGGGVFAPNPGNFTEVRDADEKDCSQTSANPVVVTTGNKVESFLDFGSGGERGLYLRRTYNHYWAYPGLFGRHWISSFDYSLVHENAAATTIWAQRPDGRRIKFVRNGTENGQERFWEDKADPVARILRDPATGGFVHHTEDRTQETYNANGYVLTVKNRQDIGWTFAYSGNYLQTVTHTSGRAVQFVWTAGRLTRVIDPDGAPFDYAYDLNAFGAGQHRLKSATLPGAPATLVAYHYEKAGQPGALSGVSYAGVRYAFFDYDSEGRTTVSRHLGPAGVVENYTFAYTGSSSTPPNPPPGPNPPGGVCPEPLSVLCELPPFPDPIEDEQALVERARIAEAERLLLSQPLAITQVAETNPLGKVAIHTVEDGRITQTQGQASTHCAASTTARGYDANGFPSSHTDAENHTTAMVFDGHGQMQTRTEAVGSAVARSTSYAWDTANNRLNAVTVTGDHRQTFAWRPDHRLHSVTVRNLTAHGTPNQDRTTSYTYTFHGNGMVATIDEDGPLAEAGDALRYTYTPQGDLTEIRNSLDHATTYGLHNGRGQPRRVVGVNGEAVEYTYDGRGRITQQRTFRNGVQKDTAYAYAASGLLQSIATPDGVTESFTYDSARRLTTATRNGVGGSTQRRFFYDAASNVTRQETWHTAPGEGAILIQRSYADYDELGRLIARRGNHGQNVGYCYDGNGRLSHVLRIGTTSASNPYCPALAAGQAIPNAIRKTVLHYDERGRLTQQTGPDGSLTRFAYDPGDRVIQVTDPRNLITRYTYDGFGQLWSQASPDTGVTTQQWNDQGLRTSTTRADGVTLAYGYDPLGRPTIVTAGSGAQAVTHTTVWDTGTNCANGKGRICQLSDPHQTLELAYTPYGELAWQQPTIEGTTGYTHRFQYDDLGRLTQVEYPGNVFVDYVWTLDQVTAVNATLGGQVRPIASGIVYRGNPYVDAQNPVPEGSYGYALHGNGEFRYEYFDTDARPFGTETSKLNGLGWVHDTHDRIAQQWNFWDGVSHVYGYDELDRLTGLGTGTVPPNPNTPFTHSFQYDANGNRTQETRPGGDRVHTVATNSNRLLEIKTPSGAIERSYLYQATGEVNRITGLWNGDPEPEQPSPPGRIFAHGFESATPTATAQFSYDRFNRLSGIDTPWLDADFKVAATGMRVAKTVNGQTTRFVYGLNGQLLHEHDTDAHRRTSHITLHGQPIALVRNGAVYWVHTDHLGRPELLADQNGNTKWRARLDAFDRTVLTDSIGGYHLGFPGQYHDTETGFVYNVFRDYDPTTGRYLQPDPIGLNGGINPYIYAEGNPISLVDFFGLQACLPYDPPLESVCPECYLMGAGRLLYAGLAKLIPSVSGAMTGTSMEQAALAVSMRNSLKDGFRMPFTPLFAGVRQPTFSQAMVRYHGDVRAVIEAAARTNAAVNAAGITGVGLGVAADYDPDVDLGVMANYRDPCRCD